MKKRYSEEQVVKILRESSSGSVAETCRKYGVSDATYYNWKKKYDGMEVSDVRRLRALAQAFEDCLPAERNGECGEYP